MNRKLIVHFVSILCLLITSLWAPSATASAQAESRDGADTNTALQLHVAASQSGLQFTWDTPRDPAAAVQAASMDALLSALPATRFGGYMLPMQTTTVLLADDAELAPQIQQIESIPWRAALPTAEPLAPPAIGWEEEYEAPVETRMLPDAPLFVLREGRVRGQRIAVLAFSPIYAEAGEIKLARRMEALAPDAQPLSDNPAQWLSQVAPTGASGADVRAATTPADTPKPPTNPVASRYAAKVHVAAPGIQRLTGAALMDIGMPEATELARLHLWYRGAKIAMEVRDSDGLLDEQSELRLYATSAADSITVGDRWNDTDIYWITYEANSGPRMATRTVTPGSASVRTTAVEEGIWEDNQLYESTMPGVDGDYWFAQQMNVDPSQAGNPANYPTVTVTLNGRLPLATAAPEDSTFTLTGSARTIATHQLSVNLGSEIQNLSWTNEQFYKSWQETISTTVHPPELNLTLLPGDSPSGIRLDKVYWRQPVQLNFGGRGAAFSGVAGTWRYQLSNLPANGTLYDVTDPANPQILTTFAATTGQFQDGPDIRQYVLAGPGVVHEPTLTAHTPVNFGAISGADAVYIAPELFFDELTPLITHRQGQGYEVAVINVQHIYDAWSFGAVSADAIRDFLRYAAHTWQPAPISAVLVGDATSDPRNYRGFLDGVYNLNRIPAYFAHVDPWLGETACENCFVQLDGESPLDGTDPDFLIDMWLGRFSVQDEEQLATVVDKILRYETAPDLDLGALWRQTSFYYTEEYTRADGSTDPAGNFAEFSDEIIHNWQSPNMLTARVYYDPRPGGVTEPWQEPDAAQARLRTIAQYKQGAGLVAFAGHSNHWQHGSTDKTLPEPYMFGFNDIFQLNNADRLSIILSMTCFTAQFTKVSATATTMDERFQRYPDGGAVAVLGPAGLTVAHGHDLMMKGFHQMLWSKPPFTARMGELAEAAYLKLFLGDNGAGACCQDARRTFLLLGDPLTPALVRDANRIYLPEITHTP